MQRSWISSNNLIKLEVTVSQNLMTSCQFGFRKGHSTSHALNYSINHIQEALKKKKTRSGNIH